MSDDASVCAATGPVAGAVTVATEAAHRQTVSYRDILRSSAIVGGSSMLNVCIGMVRTKAMAVLLGPAGFGMMGTYALISDLTRSVAQMGLTGSGVRQIASAVATGDHEQIGRTVKVLRRTSLACALLGAALLFAFAGPVSRLSFGTAGHAGSVALLSLAVFCSLVGGGQAALLQGMRRIADMARMSVAGGLLGTVIAIALVGFLGEDGVVPALSAVAACSLAASWWYSRKLAVSSPPMSPFATASESKALLKLGLAFMGSGLMTTGAAYAVRTIVLREAGPDAAGIYLAAWTLGGLYIGFVLQTMGTDFYPRLVGAAADDAECNRLVNEQALVSLLMAVPGVLLTLTLAPLAISLFYSARFAPAAELLRWISLGMALRVLSWPIGYLLVAKNRQMQFFGVDLFWTLVNVGLTWWCVRTIGIDGAGVAYAASYVCHLLLLYPLVRRLSGFRWSDQNLRTAAWSFGAIGAVFVAFRLLPPGTATLLGLFVTAVSTYVSLRMLVHLVSPQRLPPAIGRFLQYQKAGR